MSTILFSLCWLDEPGRLERNQKWLAYNLAIQKELGFDKIILLDNASDLKSLEKLGGSIFNEDGNLLLKGDPRIDIYRFNTHLSRTGLWEYPYCWRGLDYLKKLVSGLGVKKVLAIDTDFYVLTTKLASHIKNLSAGWESFRCKKYGFAEAALHIIGEDNIARLKSFPIPSYTHYNNQNMEDLLPFTKINEDFTGDRYGEDCAPQTASMDYYGQWNTGCPDMRFNIFS